MLEMFFFAAQLLLGWVAVALLPFSQKKAGRLYNQTTYRKDVILVAFDRFDRNGDGCLTQEEAKAVVKKNRTLTMSDDEFKLWFAAHARKDPNSLARDEFVQAAREMEANMDELLNRHGGR